MCILLAAEKLHDWAYLVHFTSRLKATVHSIRAIFGVEPMARGSHWLTP